MKTITQIRIERWARHVARKNGNPPITPEELRERVQSFERIMKDLKRKRS